MGFRQFRSAYSKFSHISVKCQSNIQKRQTIQKIRKIENYITTVKHRQGRTFRQYRIYGKYRKYNLNCPKVAGSSSAPATKEMINPYRHKACEDLFLCLLLHLKWF